MDTATPAPVESTPAPPPLWEDFVDIFYAPSRVYARRGAGRWGVPLLVLVAAMTLLFFASQNVLAPAVQAEMTRALQSRGLSAEQMEGARRTAGLFGALGFLVAFPLGVVLTGVLLWAVGKLFGSAATLPVAVTIAVYAQFPRILGQVIAVFQGLFMDPSSLDSVYDVSLSPARFLDAAAAAPALVAALGRLDLFTLWATLLLGIGLHVLGRVPRAQAFVAAVVVWLLAALPAVGGALASGAGG